MGISTLIFYLGLAFQLMGFTAVGLCLVSGMKNGDYSKVELAQLLGGMFFFYLGTFFKNRQRT